ncbi:mitochondrial inner membrane protein Mitofilin [Cantharellus anzutake]|uniref:mitochondrial inner membrane protein Mitofilin n=1 Tax=Cantharellus anzutake TaxID=1750568 RepID=UPI001904D86B|nr:mitochondrial inner membrane protein Mitofilin [Cantharellus anzutake]KAF8339893.1 mitochondrial inner membrane protein Mitofilin [Cantharellus anzutake]
MAISGVTFYVGSTAAALTNDRFYDFFVESVPFGESIMDYAEGEGWDQAMLSGIPKDVVDTAKTAYSSVAGAFSRTMGSGNSPPAPSPPTQDSSPRPAGPASTSNAKGAVSPTAASASASAKTGGVEKASTVKKTIKEKTYKWTNDIEPLVREAEIALKDDWKFPTLQTSKSEPDSAPAASPPPGKKPFTGQLPIGHTLPPGYYIPSESKPADRVGLKSSISTFPLPLVAPAVSNLSASEPAIAQIASNIDTLANFLKAGPNGAEGARGILEAAQKDLKQLGLRIDAAKVEEKKKLEEQLEAQALDYSQKLLQLEVDAQDKIDAQEEGYKAMLEEERDRVIQDFRQKLANELETQSQIINERLKEEVIAQGIEMQRRWIREIKVRVEQERGGRLSKLEDFATNLKKLERVTLDNSSYLDENLRLHALWSALRACSSAVDSPVRKPFREELRVLRHVTAARDDPIISTVLRSLEQGDAADTGVEPLPDLVSWFIASVAPRLENVALVPEQNAGLLSHLASSVLSTFRFKRQGLVEGDDVSSVIARAEHYLAEKDLDSAARELNQLRGVPKALLSDWLSAARKRLEVEQALAIVESQATLSSLLVV